MSHNLSCYLCRFNVDDENPNCNINGVQQKYFAPEFAKSTSVVGVVIVVRCSI